MNLDKTKSLNDRNKPFSLKAIKEISLSLPMSKCDGFKSLNEKSKRELLDKEKEILKSKPSLESLSKSARNCLVAIKKNGSTQETKDKNRVKLNWLSEVLRSSNQSVKIVNGSLKITGK